MVIRWWISGLQLAELIVSSLVHLLYGFYIFSTAVAGDLSQALFKSNVDIAEPREGESIVKASIDSAPLPPIVLVHGIFGFGKGVCFNSMNNSLFSFFNFRLRGSYVVLIVVAAIGRFIVFCRGREER